MAICVLLLITIYIVTIITTNIVVVIVFIIITGGGGSWMGPARKLCGPDWMRVPGKTNTATAAARTTTKAFLWPPSQT